MIGFDWIIVVANSSSAAAAWRELLKQRRGEVIPERARLIVMEEEKRRGNGLGALLALQTLCEQEKGPSLFAALEEGAAIALYQAAGSGGRLHPITQWEGGEKCRMVLPTLSSSGTPLTLLEVVIRQTAPLAPSLRGRISIFWTDQLFGLQESLPPPTAPVALFSQPPIPAPLSKETWKAKGLEHYGLLIPHQERTLFVEKLPFEEFMGLGTPSAVQISLGSHSLRADFAASLLETLRSNLEEERKLNTDPHFWMPLVLDWPLYKQLSPQPSEWFASHHATIHSLKERYPTPLEGWPIGLPDQWWDFGTLRQALRHFFTLQAESPLYSFLHLDTIPGCNREEGSILLGSKVDQLRAKKSLLVGVEAKRVSATESIIIASQGEEIVAHQELVYRNQHLPLTFDETGAILTP